MVLQDVIATLKNSDTMKALKTQPFHLEAVLSGFSEPCEITEDVWPVVFSSLKTIFVVLNDSPGKLCRITNVSHPTHGTALHTGAASLTRDQARQVAAPHRVFIIGLNGKRTAFRYSPFDPIEKLNSRCIRYPCGYAALTLLRTTASRRRYP